MQSRSAKTDYVAQFPAIAAALAELPETCVLDGELVTPDENGAHVRAERAAAPRRG